MLHSICQQNSAVVTGLEKISFHSNPKERQCQRMFNLPHNLTVIGLISHVSKLMLKILQARLQQYVNRERLNIQAGFRKGRGTKNQIANICWIIEKAREFQRNIYFCFVDYSKAFDCEDQKKTEKFFIRIPGHLICLLRNLYVGQEERVRTGRGIIDWFQIWKGLCQGCILSP